MGQFVVRSIDDRVIASLKVRARIAGLSFEAFVRQKLTEIAVPTADDRAALIEDFHRRHGPLGLVTPPDEIVRQEGVAR